MSPRWPWSELGLEKRATEREVKRAYAARLKQIDRNDPAAFGALRDAFAAAKTGALKEKAAPKRPRMADIVEGRTGLDSLPDDAPPIPLQEPLRPPPVQPETHVPDTATEPDTPVDPGKHPEPAQPKPAQPWGIAIGQLDAMAQEDPHTAQAAFQKKFDDALRPTHWDLKTLDALLSLDMAHNLTLRRSLERTIYDTLHSRLKVPETGYPPDVANMIETHFQWATDGVGASKRLGWRQDYQLLMYGHARSVARPARTPVAKAFSARKNIRTYAWHKLGVFALLFLASQVATGTSDTDDLVAQLMLYVVLFVALAIVFAFLRLVVKGAVAIISLLGIVFHLDGPVKRFGRWAFPATFQELETNKEFRELGIFILTAIVIALIVLLQN